MVEWNTVPESRVDTKCNISLPVRYSVFVLLRGTDKRDDLEDLKESRSVIHDISDN